MIPLLIFSTITASWAYICGIAFISLVFINRTNSSRHMFAMIFSLYCLMFALLIVEVLEIRLSGTAELLGWLSTVGMIVNCVVTPSLTLQSLYKDFGFGKRFSIIATAVSIAGLVYLCRSLLSFSWHSVLTFNLVSGTICNGLLSGFAAVNTPYNFLFAAIAQGRIQRANKVIEALMKRQKIIMDTWCAKRRKMNTELLEKSSQKSGFTFSGLLNAFKGNSSEMECDGMSAVSLAIFLEIDELSTFARKNIDSYPLRMINLAVGVGISIFGVFKICATIVSFVLAGFSATNSSAAAMSSVMSSPHEQHQREPHLLGHNAASSSSQQGGSVGQQLALLINGIMMIMSLRGFLLAAFRLSTKFTSSLAAHTATLFFTSAFGVFAMSQFAMSIRFLSASHQPLITAAIGSFNVNANTPWNNLSFLVAATAAFSLRFIWASTAATD